MSAPIATITKNSREELRVSIEEFHGHRLLNLRVSKTMTAKCVRENRGSRCASNFCPICALRWRRRVAHDLSGQPHKAHSRHQGRHGSAGGFPDRLRAHSPVTVRQLFYAATVAELPGIDKTEHGYAKVQTQVLALRREGRLPYDAIADAMRYMRKPRTFDGWEDALRDTARLYRKALWADTSLHVEIWLEESALAGVLYPVTSEYDVPLMPTGGYTSETFAHEAVEYLAGTDQFLIIYSLYDFDQSGRDAEGSLKEKVYRFAELYDVPAQFNSLGLSLAQVEDMGLPTRPAKRNSPADRRWPYAFAAELDAIPPDTLRQMVREAIEQHLPPDQLAHLKMIEANERATLIEFIGRGVP